MKAKMHRNKCKECGKDFYCLAPNEVCSQNKMCFCFLCAAKKENGKDWKEFRFWVGSCFRNIDGKKRLWLIAKMVS